MSCLFSAVVPVYNIEKYVEKCIQSLLAQSFRDFEVILVDDGSTDSSGQICDKYAILDRRIKVLHRKNAGVVAARCAGVDAAQGEYIAFVDGDDWVADDYFACFAEAVSEHNPDVICCGSVWAYEDREEKYSVKFPAGFYDKNKMTAEIFPKLIESEDGAYFAPSLWAKVFRSEIYKAHQLREGKISIGEDQASVKPCIYHSDSMCILTNCSYYYRQNAASVTKSRKAFKWDGVKLAASHLENNIPTEEFDFQAQIYRNTVHNFFVVAVSQFYREEKYSSIKKDILQHLEDPYISTAIKNCTYSKNARKGRLALFALKHRLFILMKVYSKIR